MAVLKSPECYKFSFTTDISCFFQLIITLSIEMSLLATLHLEMQCEHIKQMVLPCITVFRISLSNFLPNKIFTISWHTNVKNCRFCECMRYNFLLTSSVNTQLATCTFFDTIENLFYFLLCFQSNPVFKYTQPFFCISTKKINLLLLKTIFLNYLFICYFYCLDYSSLLDLFGTVIDYKIFHHKLRTWGLMNFVHRV